MNVVADKRTESQKHLQRALWKTADFSAYVLFPVRALCNLPWKSNVTREVSEILHLKSSACGSCWFKQDGQVSVLSRNKTDDIFQTKLLSPKLASAQQGRRTSPFSCFCGVLLHTKLFKTVCSLRISVPAENKRTNQLWGLLLQHRRCRKSYCIPVCPLNAEAHSQLYLLTRISAAIQKNPQGKEGRGMKQAENALKRSRC